MPPKTDSPNRAALLRLAAQMAEEAERFGAAIKHYRENARLTQRELAELLPGKTEGKDISRYERGHHMPGADTRAAIATALGIEVADLYAGPGDQAPTPDIIGVLGGDVAGGDLKLVLANQQRILDSLTKLATAMKRLEAQSPVDRRRPSRRSAARG